MIDDARAHARDEWIKARNEEDAQRINGSRMNGHEEHQASPDDDAEHQQDDGPKPFATMTIGEMAAEVDAAPPPCFIIHRLLVEGDYGVFGADKKLGKSLF